MLDLVERGLEPSQLVSHFTDFLEPAFALLDFVCVRCSHDEPPSRRGRAEILLGGDCRLDRVDPDAILHRSSRFANSLAKPTTAAPGSVSGAWRFRTGSKGYFSSASPSGPSAHRRVSASANTARNNRRGTFGTSPVPDRPRQVARAERSTRPGRARRRWSPPAGIRTVRSFRCCAKATRPNYGDDIAGSFALSWRRPETMIAGPVIASARP